MAATFILVHGAWHGGWCWRQVAARLVRLGHAVARPDLPGHGDDHTPMADITLEAYVARVQQVVEAAEPPVVLVGHSMGGVVISEVAERVPGHVDQLVYLAAALLADGETMLDLSFADEGSRVTANLVLSADGSFVTLDPHGIRECFFADCDALDSAWATMRLVPQAVAPLAAPIHVTHDRWGRVPRAFIVCEHDHAISPAVQRERCARIGVDELVTIATGHSPFLSDPELLAETLDMLGPSATRAAATS